MEVGADGRLGDQAISLADEEQAVGVAELAVGALIGIGRGRPRVDGAGW